MTLVTHAEAGAGQRAAQAIGDLAWIALHCFEAVLLLVIAVLVWMLLRERRRDRPRAIRAPRPPRARLRPPRHPR